MESPTTQTTQQKASTTAPVKSAIICLVLAWVFAVLPIPFISFGGMIVFNIAAFILAIICMSKNSVKPGVGVLAGSLVGTPLMYFIGLAVLGAGVASSIKNYDKSLAHQVQNTPTPAVQQPSPAISTPAQPSQTTSPSAHGDNSHSPIAADIEGDWQGTYESHGHSPIPFKMALGKPNNGLFEGTASEQISSAGVVETIQSKLTGAVNATTVAFTKGFSFKGKQYSIRYIGTYDPATKRIQGTWKGSTGNSHGSFLVWH